MRRDLKSKPAIMIKGFLFLMIGLLGFTAIVLMTLNIRIALLLIVTIWGFCRFYYFAFYVIEKYTDAQYKYAGLLDFFLWWLRRK